MILRAWPLNATKNSGTDREYYQSHHRPRKWRVGTKCSNSSTQAAKVWQTEGSTSWYQTFYNRTITHSKTLFWGKSKFCSYSNTWLRMNQKWCSSQSLCKGRVAIQSDGLLEIVNRSLALLQMGQCLSKRNNKSVNLALLDSRTQSQPTRTATDYRDPAKDFSHI